MSSPGNAVCQPRHNAEFPQFYLWQLMLFVTAAAFGFAIGRVLDTPVVRFAFSLAFAAAPITVYSIAAIVAPDTRRYRKAIRFALFVAVAGLTIGWLLPSGYREISPPLLMLFVLWAPQWLLLKFCSASWAAVSGS